MCYRSDKQVIDTHTQTQATTITGGQNWPRVKMAQAGEYLVKFRPTMIELAIFCSTYRDMIFVVYDIIIIKSEKIKHKTPNGLTSSAATLTHGPEMGLLVHTIEIHLSCLVQFGFQIW